MLPEVKYTITRVSESRYNLEDEYSVSLMEVDLNTVFEFIRAREEDEGQEVNNVKELEF